MKKMPGFREVRLYYPNNWRKYIGDLAAEEDKHFNWFLCSQRYKDPESGLYLAELSPKSKFYDEDSGDTLTIAKDVKVAKLVIADDSANEKILKHGERLPNIIKTHGYQGYAYLQKCTAKKSEEMVVCREAVFGFIDGALEAPRKESGCAIIDYAKQNNKCIKAAIPDFPSVEEIDDSLKKYSRQAVCKVLYQDIMEYMNK